MISESFDSSFSFPNESSPNFLDEAMHGKMPMEQVHGASYYPTLALTSLQKSFTVSHVEVFAKFVGDSQTYQGRIFWASHIQMNMGGKPIELKIPPKEHVTMLTMLEPDIVNTVFIPFIVDKGTPAKLSEMEFRFYDFSGKMKKIIIKMDEVDPASIIYDGSYYTDSATNSAN